MTIDEVTKRINELYHKSQTEGLSEEELTEQKKLREIFLSNVRANLKNQLENIDIVEKDGSVTHLSDMKAGKDNE